MFQFKKPKIFYGYIVVAAAFLILIAMIGAAMTYGVFIYPISEEFGWGYATITGAQSVSVLISGFLEIISGRLSDKLGPKKVVIISNLFFGSGLVLMSQVNTIWQLYFFYGGIFAIGMSAAIAPLQSTVVKWFVKKRGLVVSIFLMGLTAGSMIMPPIANQLILLWGWRTAFSILGAVLFSIVLVAAMFLKNNPQEIGELPYGIDESDESVSITGQISGLSFREAVGTVQFWLLCAFFFLIAFAMMTIMTHIVPHAINLGISSTVAAAIMATIGGVSTAAMIPNGFMADKFGVHKAAVILTIILVISMT
ncbi:MFS transporter, partial [Chloroflexota bacterium]